MSPKKLPQRSKSHGISETAENAMREAIAKHGLFIVQKGDGQDYGSDFQLEALDGNSVTNLRSHVQLKGTAEPDHGNGSVSVSVRLTNLNYLTHLPHSIYICYHVPTSRLMVRYAEEVHQEYNQKGIDWQQQKNITVNFQREFDQGFQASLNARLLAFGKYDRNRRILWNATPPEKITELIQREPYPINVSTDPTRAQKMLLQIYEAGHDEIISRAFPQFLAVLKSLPGGMMYAYMAEINLGINGEKFNKERVHDAITELEKEIESGRSHEGPLQYSIGNAWLALSRYDEAVLAFRKALGKLEGRRFEQTASQCYKNLGAALEAQRKESEARECYRKALKLFPDLSEAHYALAMMCLREGDSKGALNHFDLITAQTGSALNISSVQGYRIVCLLRLDEIIGAFREINNLLGQSPRPPWAQSWCARLISEFGTISPEAAKKAIVFWRAYLHEHPQSKHARYERLLCLYFLRKTDEATETTFEFFLQETEELIASGEVDSGFLWERVGNWAQHDRNWVEAERAYRKAHELEPDKYRFGLGTALNFLERHTEALAVLLPEAEQSKDAFSWFQVALARKGLGDLDGSIAAYKKALTIDPDYALAWFNLGGSYWNARKLELATSTWREAIRRFPMHNLVERLRVDFPFLFEGSQGHQKGF